MSESHQETAHQDPHGGHGHDAHGGHGGDHVPHVLPLKLYFATWGALIVLTVITVGASYIDFGTGNIVIALLIATIKAITVAALFMHLLFDNKFHTIIIASSLIFLGIFISFTMFDTDGRGRASAIEGDRPANVAQPFQFSRSDEAIKAAVLKQYGRGEPAVGEKPAAVAPVAAEHPAAPGEHH
jgi:cytochrome c oxidase subunit 4